MDQPLPVTLRVAVLVIAVEAAVVAVLAAILLYEDVAATAASLPGALFVTAFTIGAAATLGATARALYQRRGGVLGLAVVLQLLPLPIGYYMIKGGLGWLGAPLIAVGVLVCALLMAPASTKALGRHGPRQAG